MPVLTRNIEKQMKSLMILNKNEEMEIRRNQEKKDIGKAKTIRKRRSRKIKTS